MKINAHHRFVLFLLFAIVFMLYGVNITQYYSRASTTVALHKGRGGSAKSFGFSEEFGEKFFHSSIHVNSLRELDQIFDEYNYDLKKVKYDGQVPRLYLAKLPADSKKRKINKTAFIKVVLPLVLQVNEKINEDRLKLLALKERQDGGKKLRYHEKKWLINLASDYRCKSHKIEALLLHVDIVPPSLALAQAILESGWGTSKAAVNKNSTFGHMATKTRVIAFENLHKNVISYIMNLNRHQAYDSFRKIRADLRKQNMPLCSKKLTSGLTKYSVRGTAYTRDLRQLIRINSLQEFDRMSLKGYESLRLKP